MKLYGLILLLSVAIPFALSFDKKVQFYRKWLYMFPALLIVGGIYIAIDVFFTKNGHWGFNQQYHGKLLVFGLPMEEWLFFAAIPYACLFTHYSLFAYFPNFHLSAHISKTITITLIIILVYFVISNIDKAYTTYIFSFTALLLVYSIFDKSQLLKEFYVTYAITLIPFSIVNGLLTGSFIEQEVVWYNNSENLGIRVGTIPIEDFAYGFSLIYFNLLLTEKFTRFNLNKK